MGKIEQNYDAMQQYMNLTALRQFSFIHEQRTYNPSLIAQSKSITRIANNKLL
jgi:hypothetical protein